ncbi:uncharacterized protein L3040_009355 [Drepanopeziza brunnea f. sp. 'multigermtubi']|uniref:Zinc finger transcription factor 1 n=1 Tax=Marssonina brunnea f. sp. multigermtubi (strain MB_m1) TaxID=1072389 RepID=K1WNH6_MARBU|nr:zinc finger transcription factor 1 [Drepanopeziza brunnea f. sp. 'multigermtubi' MB_m1]EKD19205.1 zinc finger transcription factor 1 [Drepanopeziza brunnea f. sp. 'multigermtubi' MB_m1]KAJ5032763.1 hypothetical protein L3040_009355 [Drepanopeziza brunnea f. sp. 'multigermtubi']
MQRQLHSRLPTPKPGEEGEDLSRLLPDRSIVALAFKTYFEYYGDSIFCFFREFVLLHELEQGRVPVRLQFCILALMARFIEPCFTIYNGTIEASEHFAALARSSMTNTFDEMTILNMQCNLILCVHWTGMGDEHRAWFQLGIATRICTALRLPFEDSYALKDAASAEIRRRTFWACFALDRLMANGGDRRLTFIASSITTVLPGSRSDFLLGRRSNAGTINDPIGGDESITAYTLRLIDILGNIVDWSGAGGRHLEYRNPWEFDMPISRFERALDTWHRAIPSHMGFSDANQIAYLAIGEGKAFGIMWLFFYNARGHLYREYIPVVTPTGWDPGKLTEAMMVQRSRSYHRGTILTSRFNSVGTGPCDGPALPRDNPNPEWWTRSIRNGVSAAVQISTIYKSMTSSELIPLVNPFLGYCLMTSSTFHIWCSLNKWESCDGLQMGEPVKKLLIDDLRYLIQCQESWPVAAYWVKTLRMTYEQNSLASRAQIPPSPEDTKAVTDIRSKLLHFGQSVEEPEAWKGYLPPRGHDMFDLFGGKLANQEPESQEASALEHLQTSDDMLLNELLGMGYSYSEDLGNLIPG